MLLASACNTTEPIPAEPLNSIDVAVGSDIAENPTQPICPQNHTDSIIPIIYGFPGKETFQQADSGLVAIGGCEQADETWHCKIHKLSF